MRELRLQAERVNEMPLMVCRHPDCDRDFTVKRQRGRPAIFCEQHRKTKHSTARHRAGLLLGLDYQCCKDAGRKCPQHRQVKKQTMKYARNPSETAVIGDLVDCFGIANVLSSRGWWLASYERFEKDVILFLLPTRGGDNA